VIITCRNKYRTEDEDEHTWAHKLERAWEAIKGVFTPLVIVSFHFTTLILLLSQI
jgi:hypothetical protein